MRSSRVWLSKFDAIVLLVLWLAMILANQNSSSFVGSFPFRFVFSGRLSSTVSNGHGCNPLVPLYFTPRVDHKGSPKKEGGGGDVRQQTVATTADENAEWIQRMMAYLLSERDAIFRDNRVAVVLSSSPSNECQEIASAISGIGSSVADKLCFLVSPRNYEDSLSGESLVLSGTNSNEMVVETIYFEEKVNTEIIDVVVLSTRSWEIVHDDSFVNDFLRSTDAWIHMGAEFGDDFCYYSRLQEGANITLW